jgi:hypothetical protein
VVQHIPSTFVLLSLTISIAQRGTTHSLYIRSSFSKDLICTTWYNKFPLHSLFFPLRSHSHSVVQHIHSTFALLSLKISFAQRGTTHSLEIRSSFIKDLICTTWYNTFPLHSLLFPLRSHLHSLIQHIPSTFALISFTITFAQRGTTNSLEIRSSFLKDLICTAWYNTFPLHSLFFPLRSHLHSVVQHIPSTFALLSLTISFAERGTTHSLDIRSSKETYLLLQMLILF